MYEEVIIAGALAGLFTMNAISLRWLYTINREVGMNSTKIEAIGDKVNMLHNDINCRK